MKTMEGIFEVKIQGMDPMMDRKIKERIARAIAKEMAEYETSVEYDSHNMTMMTDFYEMTMGQVNFNNGYKDVREYYDEFFRKEPLNAGYGIVAGIDQIIDYVEHLHFTEEDIDYLRSLNKFNEEYLDYLRHFEFTGDIYAIPDGQVVFRNEPIVTVVAPSIECKIMETAMLSITNGHVAYATAARKIVNSANGIPEKGGIPVMEFGSRRAYGPQAAIDASKAACMAGCVGTSNVKACKDFGLTPMGTMAHSQVMESSSEYEAFREYAKAFPNKPTFLVDTYDTLKSGIPNAIQACKDENVEFGGIRIDSGDLAYLSKEARKIMDKDFPNSKICLSNGLTAETIESLIRQGACIDSLGVGDNISSPDKRVGAVYKNAAIEIDGNIIPKIKVSGDVIKTTNPGFKKIYRFYDKETGYAIGDVIATSDEIIPTEKYTFVSDVEPWKKKTITNYEIREIQTKIFENGRRIYNDPTPIEKRVFCEAQMATIYPEVQRNENPHQYIVDLSDQLREQKYAMIHEISEETAKVKKNRRLS